MVVSCSPHKRRAVDIQTDDDTSDVDDFMSEVSEVPSNASASDNKAKKRRKTKKANSVQRDTTPVLTLLRNAEGSWDNLQEVLGSEHFILEINVRITPAPPKTYKYVDWDLFRSMRCSEDRQGDTFEEFLENLKSTVANVH
ncbi:hypothetical protein MTO96_049569 [Rhipicephalus appendiculatus]